MPDSLGTSVRAALWMSCIPMNEFDGQLAQSFILMHLFTAGVILCIAPSCQPCSPMAGEAKTGVLRIIATCRGITDESKIAKHTDQMRTRLYQKTMQREMDNALRMLDTTVSRDRKSQTFAKKQFQSNRDGPRSHRESNIISKATPGSQADMLTPTTVTGHSMTLSAPDNHTLHADFPDEPVVSYLQFESLRHNDRMDSHVSEHLDEAYGAFEQMFNLDFAEFPSKTY